VIDIDDIDDIGVLSIVRSIVRAFVRSLLVADVHMKS
jgi:hypothetical protein